LPNGSIKTIEITDQGKIVVGTSAGRVAYSIDNGENWIDFSEGIDKFSIDALTIKPDGQIFAGSAGNGVYRSMFIPSTILNGNNIVPTALILNQN